MSNRFRIASTLGRRLEELGVSPHTVLRLAGLPLGLLDQSRIWVTTAELCSFYDALQQVSPDAAIGLKLGSEERTEYYSPIAIAALFTRSFRDALNRIARYKRLTSPQEIRIVERGEECAVEYVWRLGEMSEAPVWLDACFAWTVTIGRRGIGRRVFPLRVEFRRAEANRKLYEEHFGCPVQFGMEHNRIVFRVDDVNQPFLTHNPDLLDLVSPQLEAELTQQLAARSLKDRAKGILKRLLAGQRPRLEDLATEMRMSPRTLQRRLLEEGHSFQNVVEEARREMARHYLLQPSLELNEAAYLLGYEDPNSFIRAFHKWEGTSPGEWRSRLSSDIR